MAASHRSHSLRWTVTLAVAIPAAAFTWINYRTGLLCDHMQKLAGATLRIGAIDADLTGQVQLSSVALGTQLAAESIEAAVALDSLIAGEFGADEIRVTSPRVALTIDRDGNSDLAHLLRRFARPRNRPATAKRLRRITVHSGSLVARIAGIGEVSAVNVELVPEASGVRVITGPLHVRTDAANLHGDLNLARSAAEISLPQVSVDRALAVAGRGSVTAGDHSIAVRNVAVARLGRGQAIEVSATIDDAGIPRTVSASITPAQSGMPSVALRGSHIPLRPFAPLAPRAIALADAHASGRLVLGPTADSGKPAGLRIDLDGQIEGAHLDHRAIGPQPVAIGGSVRGAIVVAPDRIVTDQFAVGIGDARWTISGQWNRRQPASGQLDVILARAACNDLLRSLPVEIRGSLDGLTMTGSFGGRIRVAVDLGAALGDGVSLTTDIDNRCAVRAEAIAGDPTTLATQSDHVFADGSHARVGPGAPNWTDLHLLPKHVVAAFISAEDGRFYDHHGFDAVQIGKSLEIDLRDGQLTRGGSTISQQLVKNAFLTHRRSLDRKIQEAVLTWRLEARLRKDQILERYLNVIELGPHVFGIRAAAQYWFGRSPHDLGVRQSAFLAALTSEPRSMSRRISLGSGLDPDSAARVDTVLAAMFRDGAIDRATLDLARKLPLHLSAAALQHP